MRLIFYSPLVPDVVPSMGLTSVVSANSDCAPSPFFSFIFTYLFYHIHSHLAKSGNPILLLTLRIKNIGLGETPRTPADGLIPCRSAPFRGGATPPPRPPTPSENVNSCLLFIPVKPTVQHSLWGLAPSLTPFDSPPITFLLFSRLFTKNSCLMKPPLLQPEDEACNGSRADFSCRNCRKVCPSPSTTVVVVLYPFSLLLDF